MNNIIEINNLYKSYKNAIEPSVKGISFSVPESQIFGLLGPNGAGKSTIISIMCGLIKPTSGTIRILNESLPENAEKIKQKIGIVPQEVALYPTLTGRENLNFIGAMYGVDSKILKSKIDTNLEKLGLIGAANKRVEHYSGGMKRRTNLIAGILHNPNILFLDEPTVGIDVQSKLAIVELLKELNSEGTTIVYTSHDLEEAGSLCDFISIIDSGKIITSGKPEDLIRSNTNYKNLHDVFVGITGHTIRD